MLSEKVLSRFFLSEAIVANGYEAFGAVLIVAAHNQDPPKIVIDGRNLMSFAYAMDAEASEFNCASVEAITSHSTNANEIYHFHSDVSVSLQLKYRPWVTVYSGPPIDFDGVLHSMDLENAVAALLPEERAARPDGLNFMRSAILGKQFLIETEDCGNFSYSKFWEE